MTITCESDKDVIVSALEKIISYARNNQYIFLAQSVWWISSIIGLQQGLATYIDNLRVRESITRAELSSPTKDHPKESSDRAVSRIPRDQQEDPHNKLDFQSVHPDRINQVDNLVVTDHLDSVLKETREFLEESRIQRKKFDPLRHTRQGKVQPRKLAKKERKRLNRIIQESPDSVRNYIK